MLTELAISIAVVGLAAWMLGDASRRQKNAARRRQAIIDAIEALQPDGTGYTITEEASRRAGIRVGPNHFYPLAFRLEDQGVLASRWGEPKPECNGLKPRHYWFVGGKPKVEA